MEIKYKNSDFFNIAKHPAMGISFQNWIKLLIKNRFDFHPAFLPKILFLTGNAIFNQPVAWLEKLRFSNKIRAQEIRQPVFILGHPRSGTTYLHFVMSKDPNMAFCTTYEALIPNIFLSGGDLLKTLIAPAMPEHRPQDEMKIKIDSPMEEEFAMANICLHSFMHGFYFPQRIMENFDSSVVFEGSDSDIDDWKKNFSFFLKKLSLKYSGKNLLLKSPANTGRLKEIYELFPDAKFIHIHRNPYEVYLSNERLYEKILPLTGFQRVSNAQIEGYIIHSYEKMYRKFLHDRKSIPKNQIVEIRYENFVTDPLESLEKAYFHLDLQGYENAKPMFKTEIRKMSEYKRNTYDALSSKTKELIQSQWKFAFETFGYEL